MDSIRNDFLGQYKAISGKLKKRFLRKPNIAEASEQFGALTKELQQQECPHYAAFCCLAVARCEHTLGNSSGETQTLVQAAQLFLEAERLNHQLLCPGFSEHLHAAISCYSHAIKLYLDQKQNSLAAALCLEVGHALQNLGRISEAIPHYQKAAELHSQCTMDYLNALELVAVCKIETGDYDGALSVLTEINSIAGDKGGGTNGRIIGVFSSILAQVEVTRVLLLLLLQPTPQKLRQEHSQTLEKYSWGSSEAENSVSYMSEDLFLLLQSVVMATQSHDLEALEALQKDLWPLLSAQQNDLLHKVVVQICG